MSNSIMVRGIPYAMEQHGHDGPPVLFGHGLYFDRSMFRSVAQGLASRYRGICLDWPGHGDSGWRADGWTVQDLVDDVLSLMDALQAPDAVLVGLSQGAAVFTRLALQHPERVRALAIMDASPEQPSEAVLARIREAGAILASGDPQEIRTLFDGVGQRMLSPTTHAHRPEMAARVLSICQAHNTQGLAQAVGLARSYRSIVAQLPRLLVPTLVLWGEDDNVSPPALIDHYRTIARVTVQCVAQAGHSLAFEQPQAVLKALEHFLDQHNIH